MTNAKNRRNMDGRDHNGNDGAEEVDYELGYFVCPSCRESICFIDGHAEEHECCLKCGQRLDWSEEYHDGKM